MLNQRKYEFDLVKDNKMEHCKPIGFPFSKGLKLQPDNGERIDDPELYRRLVGKLLYNNMTRPDISYM
ncbi:Retrovirus-related Pol polyprotein from transposon RE2 [Bienertia sinuspersici]